MKIYAILLLLPLLVLQIKAIVSIICDPKCQPWEKCVDTGIVCVRAQCPTRKCVPVIKPGACPKIFLESNECQFDGQCEGSMKCCRGECHSPILVPKPGKCPTKIIFPNRRRRCGPHGCKNDQECPGDLKCCGWCYRKCVKPAPKEKPGKCPPNGYMYGPCYAECSGDDSCPGNQKCCGSCPRVCKSPLVSTRCKPNCGSGEVCVPSIVLCKKRPCLPRYSCVSTKPKPGDCPKLSYPVNGHRCTYDRQCQGSWKCCRGRCTRTVIVHPGVCPPMPMRRPGIICRRYRGPGCKSDRDCRDDLKCCGLCRRRCMKSWVAYSKPGICPVSRRPCIPNYSRHKCKSDVDCKGKEKCCKDECSKRKCMMPLKRIIG